AARRRRGIPRTKGNARDGGRHAGAQIAASDVEELRKRGGGSGASMRDRRGSRGIGGNLRKKNGQRGVRVKRSRGRGTRQKTGHVAEAIDVRARSQLSVRIC